MENKKEKKPEQEQPEEKKEKKFSKILKEMPYDYSRAGQTFVFTAPMRAKKEEAQIQNKEVDENAPSEYIKDLVLNWKKRGESDKAIKSMLDMCASFGIINK